MAVHERGARHRRAICWLPGLALLALAGCDAIPADAEQTTERIRAAKAFRVGVVAGPLDERRVQAFLDRVSHASGARASIADGATEPLLLELEHGGLDLVVGPMSANSPWTAKVHFLPLEADEAAASEAPRLMVMARNGENRWIGLLHREARAVAQR